MCWGNPLKYTDPSGGGEGDEDGLNPNNYIPLNYVPLVQIKPDGEADMLFDLFGSYTVAQRFLSVNELGADDWSTNPWNHEPNWLNALQQINPREFNNAKKKFFVLQYYKTHSKLIGEGIDELIGSGTE